MHPEPHPSPHYLTWTFRPTFLHQQQQHIQYKHHALAFKMHIPQLILGGFNYTNSTSLTDGFGKFVYDRSLLSQILAWFPTQGHKFIEWAKQPQVLALITAWWVTFALVLILLSCVGFNVPGVGAATLAAAFQSWAYGGFTPAGGIFATLTSMGMLGTLMPVQVILSAMLATVVTVIVWACGAGT